MTELTPAASALVIHRDKVLFVRSTRTGVLWAFPGGRREMGESLEQTAIREVREEVGLGIDIAGYLGTYAVASGFEITCFLATSASAELVLDATEILEARWCALSDGLALHLVSTARDALERLASLSDQNSGMASPTRD